MIKTEKNDQGVYSLILNRPDVHNAFNKEMIVQIGSFFDEVSQNSQSRLVTIEGSGPSFSAGADLNYMKDMAQYSLEENVEDASKLDQMFQKIEHCPVPVLAKVHGHILGGGMGLICVCDHIVADPESRFGFTEVNLGLAPAVISPYVLKKISYSQATSLFLSGEKFGADKALRIGLIHEISNDFKASIQKFLKVAPLAQRACKKLLKDLSLEDDIKKMTTQTIASLRVSSEGQEGMKALLEKRRPVWK